MEDPSFYLEGIVKEKNELHDFEGPLSLILMLLQKNKIEIRDIKIADILEQYLDYLHRMESMDLEIASEFVQMAAYLLYIKTKTLLDGEKEVSELELLMASLEELKAKDVSAALQSVIPAFKKAAETGSLYFVKLPEPLPKTARDYEYRHEPQELLKALQRVFFHGGKTAEPEEIISAMPKRIVYPVRDKTRQLLTLLHTGNIKLREIYTLCRSRSEVIATFVSVLELCSLGSILAVRCGDDYELSFIGGNTEELLDKIAE